MLNESFKVLNVYSDLCSYLTACFLLLQDALGNQPRMSYAQVAQHHKEQKEKQIKDKQQSGDQSPPQQNNKQQQTCSSSAAAVVGRVQGDRDIKDRGKFLFFKIVGNAIWRRL